MYNWEGIINYVFQYALCHAGYEFWYGGGGQGMFMALFAIDSQEKKKDNISHWMISGMLCAFENIIFIVSKVGKGKCLV